MNKKTLALVLLGAVLFPITGLAVSSTVPPGEGSVASLPALIGTIQTIIWMVFGLLAVISIVISGILFLFAAGQPDKIATARNAFVWGVVGVVVGILAYSILAIIGGAMNV